MIKNAIINEMTWFLEIVDANMPIAIYDAPISTNPRYPVTSIPKSGSPRIIMVNAYGSVNSNAAERRLSPAKYFPSTISRSLMGMVKRSSIVPLFRSSLKSRIVIAGTKNMKINGIILNTLLKDDSLARKSSFVKNQPVIRRKTAITIYATGE